MTDCYCWPLWFLVLQGAVCGLTGAVAVRTVAWWLWRRG